MRALTDVAASMGLNDADLVPYGRGAAKISPETVARARAGERRGKLVLVTATTPTPHGEGKTLSAIGLTQALARAGVRAVVALRQPSMGPVFGAKGGATGGGRSALVPADRINLHFTGDFHAIASAQNLIAALVDAHRYHGNPLRIEGGHVVWPRALDVNDRQLRAITSGQGPKGGVPRPDGFVITAATETMAIHSLAADLADLRARLARAVVAYDERGVPVTVGKVGGVGAATALLRDALLPNLVQTTEGAPALVHGGPFANVSHGTSSVIASRVGLHVADVVVTECGFGSDLGAEKFVHLVASQSGLRPDLAVLVTTVRAMRHHGLANLDAHLAILRALGLPHVVAVNRFPDDADEEVHAIIAHCKARGVRAVPHTSHKDGGAGAAALADAVQQALATEQTRCHPLYVASDAFETKLATLAKVVYGASALELSETARASLEAARAGGYGSLPVCVAKTPLSLSTNPALTGAPHDWTLTIRDVHLHAGAGYLVALAERTVLMPGLAADNAALHIDVDAEGHITGL